jgi:hypothetical protein
MGASQSQHAANNAVTNINNTINNTNNNNNPNPVNAGNNANANSSVALVHQLPHYSPSELNSSFPADLCLLVGYNENNLLNSNWIRTAYIRLLKAGIINRNDYKLYRKYENLLRKSKEIELILANDPSNLTARRKQIKFLQRFAHFNTTNLDSYKNTEIDIRASCLYAAQQAYFRMLKRLAQNSNQSSAIIVRNSRQEKIDFVKGLLTMGNKGLEGFIREITANYASETDLEELKAKLAAYKQNLLKKLKHFDKILTQIKTSANNIYSTTHSALILSEKYKGEEKEKGETISASEKPAPNEPTEDTANGEEAKSSEAKATDASTPSNKPSTAANSLETAQKEQSICSVPSDFAVPESILAELLALSEDLPDLFGCIGLLGVLHPKEASAQHKFISNQKKTLERSQQNAAQGRDNRYRSAPQQIRQIYQQLVQQNSGAEAAEEGNSSEEEPEPAAPRELQADLHSILAASSGTPSIAVPSHEVNRLETLLRSHLNASHSTALNSEREAGRTIPPIPQPVGPNRGVSLSANDLLNLMDSVLRSGAPSAANPDLTGVANRLGAGEDELGGAAGLRAAEDDLERAIQLSLEMRSSTAAATSAAISTTAAATPASPIAENSEAKASEPDMEQSSEAEEASAEDDEAELAAAIELSLRAQQGERSESKESTETKESSEPIAPSISTAPILSTAAATSPDAAAALTPPVVPTGTAADVDVPSATDSNSTTTVTSPVTAPPAVSTTEPSSTPFPSPPVVITASNPPPAITPARAGSMRDYLRGIITPNSNSIFSTPTSSTATLPLAPQPSPFLFAPSYTAINQATEADQATVLADMTTDLAKVRELLLPLDREVEKRKLAIETTTGPSSASANLLVVFTSLARILHSLVAAADSLHKQFEAIPSTLAKISSTQQTIQANQTQQENKSKESKESKESTESKANAVLEAADLQFSSEKLLFATLKIAVEQCKKQFQLLEKHISADPALNNKAESLPEELQHILPVYTLLSYIQRDLFRKLGLGAESTVRVFSQYSLQIFDAAIELVQGLNLKLYANSNLSSCFSRVLYSSFIGQIVPHVLLIIYSILLHPALFKSNFNAQLIDRINQFMLITNQINGGCFQLQSSTSASPLSVCNSRVVETSHSHTNTLREYNLTSLTINGASHLIIEFDGNCSTERGKDYLEVLNSSDENICDLLTGEPSRWPQRLICTGNTVKFRFHAAAGAANYNYYSSQPRFGWRALVTGVQLSSSNEPVVIAATTAGNKKGGNADYEYNNIHSLFNGLMNLSNDSLCKCSKYQDNLAEFLSNLSVRIVGKMARLLIIGPQPSSLEEQFSKFINSNLFAQGAEKQDNNNDKPITIQTVVEPPSFIVSQSKTVRSAESKEEKQELSPTAVDESVQIFPAVESFPMIIGYSNDPASQFLYDFIELTPHTAGFDLHNKMRQIIKAVGPDLLGGAVVKRTVRSAVAVLLKHLGMVNTAIQFAKEVEVSKFDAAGTEYGELLNVWRKGSSIHRYIISARQNAMAKHSQQLEENKAESKQQAEIMEQRLSYEGFVAPIFNKTLFLLSTKACNGPETNVAANSNDSDEELPDLSLNRSLSKRGISGSSNKSQQSTLSTPAFDSKQDITESLTLVRSNSSNLNPSLSRVNSTVTDVNEINTFHNLLSVYSTLHKLQRYKQLQQQETAEAQNNNLIIETSLNASINTNIPDIIALFIQTEAPLAHFVQALNAQQSRANQRILGLESASNSFKALNQNVALQVGLLHSLNNPFRAYFRYSNCVDEQATPQVQSILEACSGHYLKSIQSVNPADKTRLRNKFLNLYQLLSKLLDSPSTDVRLKCLALDLFAVEFIPIDHSQLNKFNIINSTKLNSSQQHQPALQSLQCTVNRILTCVAADFVLENGLDPYQSSAAHQYINNFFTSLPSLFSTVVAINNLHLNDLQLESENNPQLGLAATYRNIEQEVYDGLNCLFQFATNNANIATILAKNKQFIQYLLNLINANNEIRLKVGSASPRVERLAVLILQILLQHIKPKKFDDLQLKAIDINNCDSGFNCNINSVEWMKLILLKAAALITSTAAAEQKTHISPYSYYSGEVQLALSVTYQQLFTKILSNSEEDNTFTNWAQLLLDIFHSSIKDLSQFVKQLNETQGIQGSMGKEMHNSYLVLLSFISILGGYNTPISVGALAQIVSSSSAASNNEVATVLSVDRISNKARLLFAGNSSKVVDCELSKLRAISNKSGNQEFIGRIIQASPQLLVSFQLLIQSLINQNEIKLQQLSVETEQKEKEAAEEKVKREAAEAAEREAALAAQAAAAAAAAVAEAEKAQAAAATSEWQCEVCTFLNPSSREMCEICQTGQNPNLINRTSQSKSAAASSNTAKSGAIKIETNAAAAKVDVAKKGGYHSPANEELKEYNFSKLFYHEFRSACLKCICTIIENGLSQSLFSAGNNSLLSDLLLLATLPSDVNSSANSFASVQQLESQEQRLLELIKNRELNCTTDEIARLERLARGIELTFSPFNGIGVLLPNGIDNSTAKNLQFLTADNCKIKISAPSVSLAFGRSLHLIPNSLPSYYFEVRINSSGAVDQENKSADSFGVAIGFSRGGIALEGYPGFNSSYALSIYNGELHYMSGGYIQRIAVPEFHCVAGDVIGCGWNLRQDSIYFTKNGQLIQGKQYQAIIHATQSNTVSPAINSTTSSPNINSLANSTASSAIFTRVKGRFYPTVWLDNTIANYSLEINFGQSPWLFDFNSTLPSGYLQSLERERQLALNNAGKTQAEIKRRTMAEELVQLMGGSFPVEICEIALERTGDSLEASANWLIEHGYAELEKMSADMMKLSKQQYEDEKGGVANLDNSDEDEEENDLSQWLLGSSGQNASTPTNSYSQNFYGREGRLFNVGGRSGGNSAATRLAASAAQLLEDELEEEIPVGLNQPASSTTAAAAAPAAAAAATSHSNSEFTSSYQGSVITDLLKVDEIAAGQILTVSPYIVSIAAATVSNDIDNGNGLLDLNLAYSNVNSNFTPPLLPNREVNYTAASLAELVRLSEFSGRTGLVITVNTELQLVQLLFFDSATASRHVQWFPLCGLIQSNKLWTDPITDKHYSWQQFIHYYSVIESELSVRKIRTAILKLFQDWPVEKLSGTNNQFKLNNLGGAENLSKMLKLAAGECLINSAQKRSLVNNPNQTQQLNSFKSKFDLIIAEEFNSLSTQFDKNDSIVLPKLNEGNSNQHLFVTILENIIHDYHQLVEHPIPIKVINSKHPYQSHASIKESVHISGALKLQVVFDSECHIGSDMLTRLSFYRDSAYQDLIQTCVGKASSSNVDRLGNTRYQTFIVNSDTIYYKFTSSLNPDGLYGYKFRVIPIEIKINDSAALKGLNFELAAWLLDYYLTQFPSLLQYYYLNDVYNAIVHYVVQSKPAAKGRGVELLLKLLLFIHNFDSKSILSTYNIKLVELDYSKLDPLAQELEAILDNVTESDKNNLNNPELQSIVELIATTDLLKSQQAVVSSKEESKHSSDKEEKLFTEGFIPLHRLNSTSIVINSAVYGVLANASQTVDVTKQLADYCKSKFNGVELILPHGNASKLAQIAGFDKDPSPNKDKKLKINYSVNINKFIPNTQSIEIQSSKQCEKTIIIPGTASRTAQPVFTVIQAQQSPFDKIVELSRLTLNLTQSSHSQPTFSTELLSEAAKVFSVANSYYPLLENSVDMTFDSTVIIPAAGSAIDNTSNYTVMGWIFLPNSSGSKGLIHHILSKGNYNSELGFSYFQRGYYNMLHDYYNYSGFNLTMNDEHKLQFTLYNHSTQTQQLVSSKSVATESWVHIALVLNKNSIKLYVDGVEDSVKKLTAPLKVLNSDPFMFGALPAGLFELNEEYKTAIASITSAHNKPLGMEDESNRTGIKAKLQAWQFLNHADIAANSIQNYIKSLRKANFKPKEDSANVNEAVKKYLSEHKSSDDVLSSNIFFNPHPCSISLAEWNSYSKMYPNSAADQQLLELFQELIQVEVNRLTIRDELGLKDRERDVDREQLGEIIISPLHFQANHPLITMDKLILSRYSVLAEVAPAFLKFRYTVFQLINNKLCASLNLVDFSQVLNSWSLAARLAKLSNIIFKQVKQKLFQSVLRLTTSGGGNSVSINRPKALRAKEKGDLSGLKSVFGQLFTQLHFTRPQYLRTDSNNRPWRVTYEGEGGTDAGGLFRDSLSHFCSELQSSAVPLLIKVPNGVSGLGDNQELFIPNPQANSSLHFSMFSFLGKLFGMAIRSGFVLNLDLATLVWKGLVGQTITKQDIASIDSIAIQVLDKINEAADLTPENFNSLFNQDFTCTSSDGRQVLLKPNGNAIKVDYSNRAEYCNLVLEYRLNEFSSQLAAIKKGLSTIVPIQLLTLFTPNELEQMICGRREISIDLLKANTRYRAPINSSDAHVQLLWKVLNSFNHEERQLFLRFCYGQSRLPHSSAQFTTKFEIWDFPQTIAKNAPLVSLPLPVSHTW